MILSQKDIRRFWAKVDVRGEDECWPWLAGKTKHGHGVFSVKHKWIAAHRVSFFIANNYLPDIKLKHLVMHDCENPSCQNPKHLLDGTIKENGNYPGCIAKLKAKVSPMLGRTGELSPRWGSKHSNKTKQLLREKAIQRGGWHKGLKRSRLTRDRISTVTRGENHGQSRLTDEIVRSILKSKLRNIDLAELYNVDPSVISSIRRRTRWKHVKL